jgi:hypothetical protein
MLVCSHCEYNLRRLWPCAACPECGHRLARGDRSVVRRRRLDWLRVWSVRLRWAQRTAMAAMAAALLSAFLLEGVLLTRAGSLVVAVGHVLFMFALLPIFGAGLILIPPLALQETRRRMGARESVAATPL